MGRRGVVFCDVNDAPLLSLDRFPPNFSRTRVKVLSRDTWFLSYSRKVSSKGSNFPKTVFLRYFRVSCLCSAYESREMFCDAYALSIP